MLMEELSMKNFISLGLLSTLVLSLFSKAEDIELFRPSFSKASTDQILPDKQDRKLPLLQKRQPTLPDITPENTSFTSAAVATDNFEQTNSLRSIYYAMFIPNNRPRWQGNLKKYKIINKVQVGVNGVNAINVATGNFSASVQSYWSSTLDGDSVQVGGVASWFARKEVSDRVVYSDIGRAGSLVLLNQAALNGQEKIFANNLAVPLAEVSDYLNWTLGMDVDDEDNDGSKIDMRGDVFGDPLHSTPVVVNYGTSIRVVIGTNSGALHMFEDEGNTVSESWAFMPEALFSKIKDLRDNFLATDKIYGIDGQITAHINDKNGNGIIEADDSVWIFFGLRRGGSAYYALDISQPDSPSLLWHIKAGTRHFETLAQTWSQPKVGFSKINIIDQVALPVLFFGGGYDTNKDNDGVGTPDSKGRSIYMVDAKTGTLLWSMSPQGGDTHFTGTDSIPAAIGLLDSDGDGLVDRLYAGDTGGNLWRIDMPGSSKVDFSVFKLASLGGNSTINDRRFFYQPAIARALINETLPAAVIYQGEREKIKVLYQKKPYETLLIASSDRANPLGTDTTDISFMIKDKNIKTQTFSKRCIDCKPAVINKSQLFNFSTDAFTKKMTKQDREALALETSAQSGWFIDFSRPGEKATSAAIILQGIAYYTSYTPPACASITGDCPLATGKSWLYGLDLVRGSKRYDWSKKSSANRSDRIAYISEQFLGAPILIVNIDDKKRVNARATGKLIVGQRIISVDFILKTMRTSLYITADD